MSVSWRETASDDCQADFDALLDECIDIAANNLVRNWGLDPTAIAVDARGGKSVVMAEDSHGLSSREELVNSLRSSASAIRSFAIVSRVSDDSADTLIEIHLEHRDIAIQMVFPYEIPDSATFDLGTPRSAVADHRLFTREYR
ncbi:hypothetical protein [Mycobacterium sp. TY814]|uniref:hypothetical protein n=1 Tax=unclassified Mycobacterium TaxID=2642494 RepID=UPI0027417668|nr:hypothetical protein [Mycobacterium sp. TY814]MDP7721192.1 hypothetical protein [Mycobacterium sp. TY814]